jgi:hypothetical protein
MPVGFSIGETCLSKAASDQLLVAEHQLEQSLVRPPLRAPETCAAGRRWPSRTPTQIDPEDSEEPMTDVTTTEGPRTDARATIAALSLFLARISGTVMGVLTGLAELGLLIYLAIQGEWGWFAGTLLLAGPIIGVVGWLATMVISGPLFLLARSVDRETTELIVERW